MQDINAQRCKGKTDNSLNNNIIHKDKAMLGRVDTGIAFILWKSLFLFRNLLLRVPIRTINNQSI